MIVSRDRVLTKRTKTLYYDAVYAVSPTRSGFPDSGPDPDFLRVCSPEKVWFLFKSLDLNKILTPNALNSQWTVGMMSLALGSVDASTNPKI